MKSFAVLSLAGAAAAAGVSTGIAPSASSPAGCSENYSGSFEISVVNVTTTKRSLQARKALTITLSNGVLTDDEGRYGYIASNNQFQFDNPIQAGAIYTGGWSVCSNDTLALGGSAIFYQCLSGTFYNLYDESTGNQCSPIYIDVIGAGAPAAASEVSDGQVTASAVTSASAVSQISDGQIQATTATPKVVTQISDGQIQASTAATSGAVVTQISDGQIQATTATPKVVTQISDGQIQASTGVASTTKGAVVTQISDGQIQATTGTPSATKTGAVVTQISDGQIQAATNGSTIATVKPTVSVFTGAAALPTMKTELFGLAAGVLAMAMF